MIAVIYILHWCSFLLRKNLPHDSSYWATPAISLSHPIRVTIVKKGFENWDYGYA